MKICKKKKKKIIVLDCAQVVQEGHVLFKLFGDRENQSTEGIVKMCRLSRKDTVSNTENIKVLRVLEVGQINRQRLPGYIGQTENDEAFTHKVLIKRV